MAQLSTTRRLQVVAEVSHAVVQMFTALDAPVDTEDDDVVAALVVQVAAPAGTGARSVNLIRRLHRHLVSAKVSLLPPC